jgi:hypothetical protein
MIKQVRLIFLVGFAVAVHAELTERDRVAFYDSQVLPIIEQHCLKCHGGEEKLKGGLSLTSRKNLLEGGDVGAVIDVEHPEKSLLLEMISYRDDDHQMPPKAQLPSEKLAVLAKWAELGFPFNPNTERYRAPKESTAENEVNDANRNWWAYRKISQPAVPKPKNARWQGNPIDAFIAHQLEGHGLTPNGPATRAALIRRAYYNLIGLPPDPAEVAAFIEDKSPDAWEKVIDDLLDRPQYGEKWGRHWLDLVRFAESNGYERDGTKPHIWRYRDYVISAFNQDKPYDQFIMEQLAGDEMDNPGGEQMIATGYYRLGVWDDEPADRDLNRYDVLDGIVSTTGETFLGMTIGCARCHAHKIDPFPHEDYYSFLSFFQNITDYSKGNGNVVKVMGQPDQEAFTRKQAEQARKVDDIQFKIHALKRNFVKDYTRANPDAELNLSDMVNVRYRFYRDTFSTLPDFDALRAENTGHLEHNFFDLGVATRKDAIGLVFEGQLVVQGDGEYGFAVDSKDGSRLIVNGRTVVEHDGLHPVGTAKTARIQLKRGLVPIRFEYFNQVGTPAFKVSLVSKGKERYLSLPVESHRAELLPDSRVEGTTWAYTTKRPGADWYRPAFDDRAWKAGAGPFGTSNTPGITPRTTWNTPDIWLRKTISVDTAPASLYLSVIHDEDAEVYINGRVVRQLRGHTGNYLSVKLDPSVLKRGSNTITVHCRQTSGGQGIDLGLYDKDGEPSLDALMEKQLAHVTGRKQADHYKRLRNDLKKVNEQAPTAGQVDAMVVKERGVNPPETHVLIRGNPHVKGAKVAPAFPQILEDGTVPVIAPRPTRNSSGRRTALAQWIASEQNPLTSRVMVNRVWQHHFGRGIVRSTSNFGRVGDLPTHPELLDWLAWDFMHDKNWSVKKLHKQLMLSQAYQVSSTPNASASAEDPRNNQFWRFNMRRLSAEEIRDTVLSVTGSLNLKMGGASYYSTIPAAILATSSTGGRKWGKSAEDEQNRRSVYIFTRRSLLDPMLVMHDSADTDSHCSVRFTTTVPTQALSMMNGEFMNKRALAFAERLRNAADTPAKQVQLGIELVTSRPATKPEIDRGLAFMAELKQVVGMDDKVALDRFALLAMNMNEFIYLD